MARLQREGLIAASLDRSTSTVARELTRNSSNKGYPATPSNRLGPVAGAAPSWTGTPASPGRIAWSPAQVAGRLALERGGTSSPETIYRFVHAQGNRTKACLVPAAWQDQAGPAPASGGPPRFLFRRPLAQRPKEAEDRSVPGHWEADLMLFGTGASPCWCSRSHSRLILGQPMFQKAADPMAQDDPTAGDPPSPMASHGEQRQ